MASYGEMQFTPRGEREIVMERTFAAPRALLFEARTQPEWLRRWLTGMADWTLAVCQSDLRPGGAIRFVWRQPDGREMGLSGTYREVEAPARIVHTELFDQDWTGGETTVTTVLTEGAGRTTLTTSVLYASAEARDRVVASGMAHGVAASYDRLAGLLPAAR